MGKHAAPKQPGTVRRAAVTTATAAAIGMGGVVASASAASATDCPSGQVLVMGECGKVTGTAPDEVKRPAVKPSTLGSGESAREVKDTAKTTGSTGIGTVSKGSDAVSKRTKGNGTVSAPAPGTGGLIFRDAQGRDLGSGMGEGDQFEFIKHGPAGSGLIYVKQITKGMGGWGTEYIGYVKVKYTMAPELFS